MAEKCNIVTRVQRKLQQKPFYFVSRWWMVLWVLASDGHGIWIYNTVNEPNVVLLITQRYAIYTLNLIKKPTSVTQQLIGHKYNGSNNSFKLSIIMHCSHIFWWTVNRSPPVSQAFAEASVSDHSPLTESSDPYAPIANSSVICRRPQTKPEIYWIYQETEISVIFQLKENHIQFCTLVFRFKSSSTKTT